MPCCTGCPGVMIHRMVMPRTRQTATKKSGSRAKPSAGRVTRRRSAADAEPGSLESGVRGLAAQGTLAKAAQGAIKDQQRQGVPVTYQRGNQVIKQHADGRV